MTEPVPATESSVPAPQFSNEAARLQRVELAFPLDYDAVHYDAIVIKRLTAREVSAHIERMRALAESDPNRSVRFPMYFTAAGQPVPEAVLDALDDDDAMELERETLDFLPRRFRFVSEPEAPASIPPTGGSTAPSSEK